MKISAYLKKSNKKLNKYNPASFKNQSKKRLDTTLSSIYKTRLMRVVFLSCAELHYYAHKKSNYGNYKKLQVNWINHCSPFKKRTEKCIKLD